MDDGIDFSHSQVLTQKQIAASLKMVLQTAGESGTVLIVLCEVVLKGFQPLSKALAPSQIKLKVPILGLHFVVL